MNTVLQFYLVAVVFCYMAGIFFGQVKFVIQDCWLGLYWKTEIYTWDEKSPVRRIRTFYLCLLPCLPIIWTTTKRHL